MLDPEKVALFVSWSGDTSKCIAEILKEWLTILFDDLDVFFTPDDIPTGNRWSNYLAQKLQECEIGLFIYTSQNLDNLWMAFEAGALSKRIDTGRVIPLLFGVNISDLKGPLSQFQARRFTQDGILKTLEAINNCLPSQKSREQLISYLKFGWPTLEKRIGVILKKNEETDRTERQDVGESIDNLYSLIQTSPWYSTEFPEDICTLVQKVNNLVQQVKTTSRGSYLFIDGAKSSFAAFVAATMRAKKSIRSTRFSPMPISGNYDNYGQAIYSRIMGENGIVPLERYTRIVAANNLAKLKDIEEYLEQFPGKNFDLYLTKKSNSFDLVIIDEEEVFIYFHGQYHSQHHKGEAINSTLHIVGQEVTRNFIDIYEQLHDPKYDPNILKVEFKYIQKDRVDEWRQKIENFFQSSQAVCEPN